MATQESAVFILIPGSFSFPLVYEKITPRIRAKGHEVVEISLLTCVQDPESEEARPASTMYHDAAIVNRVIKEWVDKGYDVVVAANSYGGFPGSEGVKGMSKSDRTQRGLKGGVVGLVMLASFLPDVGDSVVSIMGESMPDQLKNPQGEYMELNKKGGGKWIFNRLSEEDADHYMSKIGYHSRQSYSDAVTYAGWKYIPTTYFATSRDYGLSPDIQKHMCEVAQKKGANIKLVETDGDHVPMLSLPDEVTQVLLDAATWVE